VSDNSARPFKILAISDYICPWCYIGLKRIQQIEKEFFEEGRDLAERMGARRRR
jgi:predicted DsbA family dithiol-disulfide isomerase